ncbi:hypothetical protein, partial [Pseudomonas gelidaquae]|uniref:hypothetical protein n=1 Tax=Pseudomonas sp. IB20 TaxID=1702250 RepID=UPI001C444730
ELRRVFAHEKPQELDECPTSGAHFSVSVTDVLADTPSSRASPLPHFDRDLAGIFLITPSSFPPHLLLEILRNRVLVAFQQPLMSFIAFGR